MSGFLGLLLLTVNNAGNSKLLLSKRRLKNLNSVLSASKMTMMTVHKNLTKRKMFKQEVQFQKSHSRVSKLTHNWFLWKKCLSTVQFHQISTQPWAKKERISKIQKMKTVDRSSGSSLTNSPIKLRNSKPKFKRPNNIKNYTNKKWDKRTKITKNSSKRFLQAIKKCMKKTKNFNSN